VTDVEVACGVIGEGQTIQAVPSTVSGRRERMASRTDAVSHALQQANNFLPIASAPLQILRVPIQLCQQPPARLAHILTAITYTDSRNVDNVQYICTFALCLRLPVPR